ncbi:MAG: hypothetical protein HDT46_03170 [Ruminococcaceae bacterium]|nr:hypothetical protein [Oscillospiraceae bacterium]
MKKIAKIPITFESRLSSEEFAEKVKNIIAEQEENVTYSEKGRQIFYWESLGDDKYSLKFYHSYKSDMCDTAFYGQVNKGLSGCQLDGHIKKPGGIWAIFWVIIAVAFLILAAFSVAILLSETPETGLIPVFLLTLVPVAFVEVNLLMFDKKRLKAINEYLREFTTAENYDVLSEELEEDERG